MIFNSILVVMSVLSWFDENVYGKVPPKPAKIEFNLVEQGAAFGNYAERRQYQVVSFNSGLSNVIEVLMYLPKGAKSKVPAFVYPNFYGNHATVKDIAVRMPNCRPYDDDGAIVSRGEKMSRANISGILERGYAAVTFCYGSTYPDYTGGMAPDRFTRDAAPESIFAMYPNFTDKPMAHGAWAWGAMRVRDLIETIEAIDQQKVAIAGHSRMGMNAIVTGVHDRRYSLVCANGGGMKPLSLVVSKFVHWFMPLPKELPYEHKDFVALIAPRALMVTAAENDKYQPSDMAKKVLDQADYAWREQGLSIGWHSRPGEHAITAEDWQAILDYAEKTLGWQGARSAASTYQNSGR